MRIKSLLLSISAVLVLMAVSSDAVVNIQNIGSGARASSLGNAFVAVADNADAVFANPAGLHQLKGTQLAYTNVSLLFSGIDGDNLGQHVVSYARPGNKMSLGLGYERIGSDLLSENGAFLSLGFKLSPKLSLGVTGKYVFWSVGDIPNDAVSGKPDPLSNQSQGAIGADIGLLWKAPIRDARVGLLLKNALQPNVCYCSTEGTVTSSDGGDVPMDLHIGVSTSVAEASMVSVQWVMRDLTGEETDKRLVVGGETKVAEGFMLRAGGSKIFEDEASGDVNAGLGYKWNKTQFDYGYHIPLDLTETNGSHRFSLGYLF